MSDYEMHIVDLASKLGHTLAYLHKIGIILRDVDFDNIIIVQTDGI